MFIFFLMLQYHLINNSVISYMLNLLPTSYLVGRFSLLIFLYVCLFGECGVWQTFHLDILCHTVWCLAFCLGYTTVCILSSCDNFMFETIHSLQGETTKKHHQGMKGFRKGR